jgi:hypothetical protein
MLIGTRKSLKTAIFMGYGGAPNHSQYSTEVGVVPPRAAL